MAESQDLEQQCVTAFKQGNHDQAVQLLPQLQQPSTVSTEFKMPIRWQKQLSTNVTLLHLAAYHGWLDIVKSLYIPDCRDSSDRTPLIYATAGGCLPVIDYLIKEQDCDPTTPTRYGNLPLHVACLIGHFDIANFLITKQKCDPNSRNNNGATPLYCASSGGHMNIIRYLVTELGCDPTTPDNNGNQPLHITCLNGHLNATKCLIAEQKCDPTSQNKNGSTPLHFASQGGHMNIIHYLITELGCDPKIPNIYGNLPLHIACLNGHLNATKYFIAEQNCDPTSRNKKGWTPLHYSSECGHTNIIHYLITELGCDPTTPNKNGDLPLHIASRYGHLDAVKYLITNDTYDSSCGKNSFTPLHYAIEGGHMNVVQYLITELGCDPKIPDSNGNLPLHTACLHGHFDVVKFLITDEIFDSIRCRSNIKGNMYTPLHYASRGGDLNIIQYLITELGCDPSMVDDNKRTVLHWASYCGHISVVQWLLHNTQVDIMAKDINGDTCIDLAKDHYEILKIFEPLVDSSKHFPIHKFGKTVLTGNSAAGKTTLAKVIAKRATKQSINWLDSRRKIENIETHTAGIVPSQLYSWEVGNMVVFDLAGHTEYHSSHSAIMETVMQQSPATFINVIDLSNSDAKIAQQLHYWLNFIDNATCRTNIKSCLIVVGSHADLLSKEEFRSTSTVITNVLKSRGTQQDFMGIVSMDCRRLDSKGTRKFISLLSQCQQTLSTRAPSLSYYCHLLYAFLKSKPEIPYFTLEMLVFLITRENCPIPAQSIFLTRLLTALNDKGMVIFIKNEQKTNESWIIVNIKMLLKDINGKLFGEVSFKPKEKIIR